MYGFSGTSDWTMCQKFIGSMEHGYNKGQKVHLNVLMGLDMMSGNFHDMVYPYILDVFVVYDDSSTFC